MFVLFHPEFLSAAPSPSLPLPIRVLQRHSLIAHFPHHFPLVTPLFPTLTKHRAHNPCRINTEHPMKDASPERALQRASRRISPQEPPPKLNALYQIQSPRISYTTKDFKSFRINTEHPAKDASPERALQRASRRISPQVPPSNLNGLYQIQSSRISYTTKDFKSCRISTYKKIPHFSHLIENTQLQVLCNQHLRVFASQVLWIQHLHENRGGGGTMRVNTPPPLADAPGVPRPSLTSAGSHPIMAGIFGDSR